MSILLLEQPCARGRTAHRFHFHVVQGEPAGFGDVCDEEGRALVHRYHADGLSLEIGKCLDLGLRDDEMRGPLGDAGDDTKRAALVGLGDDAFDRGDCDLVRAGAQIVKDLFRAIKDFDRHIEARLLEGSLLLGGPCRQIEHGARDHWDPQRGLGLREHRHGQQDNRSCAYDPTWQGSPGHCLLPLRRRSSLGAGCVSEYRPCS
jgi:hypothetical protein